MLSENSVGPYARAEDDRVVSIRYSDYIEFNILLFSSYFLDLEFPVRFTSLGSSTHTAASSHLLLHYLLLNLHLELHLNLSIHLTLHLRLRLDLRLVL